MVQKQGWCLLNKSGRRLVGSHQQCRAHPSFQIGGLYEPVVTNNAGLYPSFQIGGLYEPVVTNNAGLYRYRQGDIVRVVDFYRQAPCIDFQFRFVTLFQIRNI